MAEILFSGLKTITAGRIILVRRIQPCLWRLNFAALSALRWAVRSHTSQRSGACSVSPSELAGMFRTRSPKWLYVGLRRWFWLSARLHLCDLWETNWTSKPSTVFPTFESRKPLTSLSSSHGIVTGSCPGRSVIFRCSFSECEAKRRKCVGPWNRPVTNRMSLETWIDTCELELPNSYLFLEWCLAVCWILGTAWRNVRRKQYIPPRDSVCEIVPECHRAHNCSP